ncbi:MAG: DUF4251 domain-containing protein [Proteiniphilum sp.]|nr:DUF4251 domain-containing protein [Proteiniphilum sp.]
MKKLLFCVIGLFFFLLVFQACGTTQSAAEKEKLAAELRDGVVNSTFTFDATYAYPTGYRSVYLSPYYDVKISLDTIRAYLPYYGRAYRAPMDPREGGFIFTSTDFQYRFVPGKRKGNWIVEIAILDLDRPVSFSFDIWENGSARLTVNDVNRQPISFQGDVTIKKEEVK